MNERPHICNTLRQLRGWVTLAALCLTLACLTQMLVFGFVHYTDVRFTTVEAKPTEAPLKVVVGEQPKDDDLFKPAAGTAGGKSPKAHAASAGEPAAVDPNRVLTSTDGVLRTTCDVAQTVGVIAAVWLCVLSLLSVCIAGPALVPGVEKAVTAGVWSIILCMLCLPLNDAMSSLSFRGVFASYHAVTAASAALDAGARGTISVMAQHLVLPLVGAALSMCVLIWHRIGVERGTLLLSAMQQEHMLEQEMAHIRSRGVNTASHRSAGALSRVLGEQAAASPSLRVAAGAESMSAQAPAQTDKPTLPVQGLAPSFARKLGKHGHPDAGEPERRLI